MGDLKASDNQLQPIGKMLLYSSEFYVFRYNMILEGSPSELTKMAYKRAASCVSEQYTQFIMSILI